MAQSKVKELISSNGDASNASAASKGRQRGRLSQEDVPAFSLDQALRVAKAIAENYAFKPTKPLNVAGAMKMTPGSGQFRMLTGAAIAYGMTTGGAFAPEIALTPLGMRIVRPTKTGDDVVAKREALLRPKVVGDFLRQYDQAALPSDQIAKNVLLERGVPAERLDEVHSLIVESAEAVGFLKELSGKKYVDLAGAVAATEPEPSVPATPRGAPLQQQPAFTSSAILSPGVHINIEIHIAADATSETIEEIFRNMRRYVLNNDDATAEQ